MKNCLLEFAWRGLAALAVGWMSAAMLSAGVITYMRDGGGRLTGVQYANGKAHGYTYDAAGNLTRRAATLPGLGGDLDGDGLPDDWELLFFGNLGRDGTGDFDGDAFTDRSEYLAGTNPIDAMSLLTVTRALPSAGQFTIEWSAVSGRTYRVQYKNDLNETAWSDLAGDVIASGPTASKADGLTNLHRFYRVMLRP
jgi:YD repeat-containing protein